MSTHQHQLKAHCINRKQRARAAAYIDDLEDAIRNIAQDKIQGNGQELSLCIDDAMELISLNHGGK